MPDLHDPFEVLRRDAVPVAPRSVFAAALRLRLEQELDVTTTDVTDSSGEATGTLGLVHLRVEDADRAMRFFGEVFGWETERVVFEDHISHYTLNTAITVRLLDDRDPPPVVPSYQVVDVPGTAAAIAEAGGAVVASDITADGGSWARATDPVGIPLLVYRPRGHAHGSTDRVPSAEVGLIFIEAGAEEAERFYGAALGWHLVRSDPDSHYFHAVPNVGVFDEGAARGIQAAPRITLYLQVPALTPAVSRVNALGGHAGPIAHDMGPYFRALCTDDQGTEFGLMAEALE
jgi:predicted enzyme related to lactoylglutathione lyase